jgi:hypothetical protein
VFAILIPFQPRLAHHRRGSHYRGAIIADQEILVAVKTLEYAFKLGHDIGQDEGQLIEVH